MQTRQGNMLLALQNAQTYLNNNATALGDTVPPATRKLLDDSIVELSGHASVQDSETRAAASALALRHSLRSALIRDRMMPIAKIAKLELASTPELVSLSLPKNYPTVERLAALANGMALAAEKYENVFLRAGLKTDFIQSLRTASDDMVQALKDRMESKSKVRVATSALSNKLSRARKVVHVLDVMVKSALVGNADLLEGWNLVKRTPRPRNTPVPVPSTPTPTPTPATSTPSTATAAAA
jgi:hypothetical protein